MQNKSKEPAQSPPSTPPGEGKASEPTIIAEQRHQPGAGPQSIPSDKSAVTDSKDCRDKKSTP